MSLEQSDREAASHAFAARVALPDIEGAIGEVHYFTALDAVQATNGFPSRTDGPHPLALLSVCILVMRNGFTVIGHSAPASPENFNADFGRKLAYENAIRQLWPLMGFALRDRLAAA